MLNNVTMFETVFCQGGQIFKTLPDGFVPCEDGATWMAWAGETFLGNFRNGEQALAAVEMAR